MMATRQVKSRYLESLISRADGSAARS